MNFKKIVRYLIPFLLAGGLLTGCGGSSVSVDAGDLAYIEVVEDIAGNANGVSVTAEQLNAIDGVSGAINSIDYTQALQDGEYANPKNPTAQEIQEVVDAVNAEVTEVVPTLENATGSVAENAPEGTIAGTMTITNEGSSAITAITLSGTGHENFVVSIDGSIGVSASAALDYETTQIYNLTAIATNDAGESSSVTVTIIVTDHDEDKPVFTSSATATVNENQTDAIALVATDANMITYSISGTDADSFNINSSTGVVTFKAAPDYETKNSYTFIASATDSAGNEETQDVTVTISNIADVKPILANSTGNIAENAATGDAVGAVTITDSGDSAITAIALSGTGNANFTVLTGGDIVVAAGAALDYETTVEYNFTAIATNSAGDSAEVDVNITVNNIVDNVPVLATPGTTTVSEDITLATEVVTVVTNGSNSDENTVTGYTITGGNTGSDFNISSSGVITTTKTLDYERTIAYTLQVKATNSAGDSAEVDVNITVTDIDEIAPELTITDNESGIVGVTLVEPDWVRDTVTFTFTFTEPVTGFEASDIVVSGGDKGSFSGSGDTYTLEVTPSLNSKTPIIVDVAADKAVDATGNGNIAATQATQEVNTQKAFITTWKTDNTGISNDDQVRIRTGGVGGHNYTIDWGDGESDTGVTGDITHTYSSAGTYTVKITGIFPRISFSATGYDNKKLLSIEQWGTIEWESMNSAFFFCSNLEGKSLDRPNLAGVINMSNMFNSASAFNQDISGWDVSRVIYVTGMFQSASAFNQDISGWDVSSVRSMHRMFYAASAFNQDISGWDVSSVRSMQSMFQSTSAFNQDISGWDVSNVSTMTSMFQSASAFNQDISGWDVSNVTDMSSMFSSSAFNKNIGSWDVSSVISMQSMFQSASAFNQDISSWDVSSVSTMNRMFKSASAFNQDISSWDVSSVTNMSSMFSSSAFNKNIGSWDVSSVRIMSSMFQSTNAFNQDISGWNVSSVTSMNRMFRSASAFNQDISSWNVSSVTDMDYMFSLASAFSNNDLSAWTVSQGVDHTGFSTSWGTGNTEPIW